jgi:hypothetical protein
MSSSATHTIFVLLKTARPWLDMEPAARFAFIKEKVMPVLNASPDVRLRFFDTESYSARVTDVVVFETDDLASYRKLVKDLRDTDFWDRYYEVLEIVPAVEDAYAAHYGIAPLTSGQS